MKSQLSIYWMKCSGDIDGRVPVTSTKYSLSVMKLPVKTAWYPWFVNGEVISFLFMLSISSISLYPFTSTWIRVNTHYIDA